MRAGVLARIIHGDSAMSNLTIAINSETLMGLNAPAFARANAQAGGREVMQQLVNELMAVASGARQSPSVHINWSDTVDFGDDAMATPAAALLVGATLTGAVGGTIAGTLVTATASGGDTNTQGLVAAAINANATVNRIVNASNVLAEMTLASVTAGQSVVVGGITFTAVATLAEVTRFGLFNINGTDTQDAQALARAINRHPALTGRFVAVASTTTGQVFLGPVDRQRPLGPFDRIGGLPPTITAARPVPAPGAQCMVMSNRCGAEQNEIRLTASGTGMTAVTNGAAGLLGGGGGGSRANTRMVVLP
jgi:hypothetical protein